MRQTEYNPAIQRERAKDIARGSRKGPSRKCRKVALLQAIAGITAFFGNFFSYFYWPHAITHTTTLLMVILLTLLIVAYRKKLGEYF